MPKRCADDQPIFFTSPAEFRAWLAAHHDTATSVVVGYHRVSTGRPSLTWSESVDEALCFGWIDGIRRRHGPTTYTNRFTPRKPRSNWSAINIAKVKVLQASGRMTAAGLSAFARRTRARTYSYDDRNRAALDAAELATFKRQKAAWRFFEAQPPGYRKTVTHWVVSAKRAETRAARLAKLIDLSTRQRRLI